ncbi:hypothetical protein V7161_23135 [Neobacillus drentensis]|uniref:hypothetical protein n=1 Tax=Neobacillus drentensis TaxID=220684 RepID=UPI003001908C
MNSKEKLLWSVALPGFGQLLNGNYLKGIIFIALEFVINVQSHFNDLILHSFNGEIVRAIDHTEYKWLMFYPCVYFFAMWDAYKDAGGGKEPYSYLPFVFFAYFVTVGLMYSARVKLFGVLLGTVWFPMLCVIPGVLMGMLLKGIFKRAKL